MIIEAIQSNKRAASSQHHIAFMDIQSEDWKLNLSEK